MNNSHSLTHLFSVPRLDSILPFPDFDKESYFMIISNES